MKEESEFSTTVPQRTWVFWQPPAEKAGSSVEMFQHTVRVKNSRIDTLNMVRRMVSFCPGYLFPKALRKTPSASDFSHRGKWGHGEWLLNMQCCLRGQELWWNDKHSQGAGSLVAPQSELVTPQRITGLTKLLMDAVRELPISCVGLIIWRHSPLQPLATAHRPS